MAVRLPVVICQAPPGHPAREREAEFVAELILESGGDVHLIRSLAQPGETDRLMLEGITGEFALCAWDDPSALQAALSNLGIPCRLGRHQWHASSLAAEQGAAAASETAAARRVYVFDLRGIDRPQALSAEIKRILADRRTPLFTLPGIGNLAGSSPAGSSSGHRQNPAPSAPPSAGPMPDSRAASHELEPLAKDRLAELDVLVDLLDESDL